MPMIQTYLSSLSCQISTAFTVLKLSEEEGVDESHSERVQLHNLKVRFLKAIDSSSDIKKRVEKYDERCNDIEALIEEGFRSLSKERERSNRGDGTIILDEKTLEGVKRLEERLEDNVFFTEDLRGKLKNCMKELHETQESVTKMMMTSSSESHGSLSSMDTKLKEAVSMLIAMELTLSAKRVEAYVKFIREKAMEILYMI